MRTRRVAGLGFFFLLGIRLAAGQALVDVDPAKVGEVFADYDRTDSPGCSVGVIRDGELVHARGYGMANLDLNIALTPRGVFRIGSTSKQFTAAAVLLLDRQGRLSLDDDIRKWVPELRAYEQPVTIRHLIHHTSGYRDYLTLWTLAGARDEDWASDAEVVSLLARQLELNFPPGTDHLYSNSGYFLLSQVVRSASGNSLREWAQENIFGPLDMNHTHFHDDYAEIVPLRATGYAPREGGGFEISTTTLEMVGDGGVFTSVEDLVAWDRSFYDDRLGEGFVQQMLTTAVLPEGEDTKYGFGLGVEDYHGLKKIAHGGAFVGYRAELIRFPDQRLSVICLCNRADAAPTRLAQKVADLYLAEYLPEAGSTEAGPSAEPGEPLVLSEADLAVRLGAYQRRDGDEVVRLERSDEGLVHVTPGGHRLRALSADRFTLEGLPFDVVVEFEAPVGEGLSGFRMIMEGEPEGRFEPIELAEPSAEEVSAWAGDFHCPELSTTLRIVADGTSLRVENADPHRQAFEDPLRPTFEDTFAGGGITLVLAPAGAPPGELRLHMGRVRNLRCVRQ